MKVDLVEKAAQLEVEAVGKAIEKRDVSEWEKSETLHWFVAVKRRKFPLLMVPEPYIYEVARLLHEEEQQDERHTKQPAALSGTP